MSFPFSQVFFFGDSLTDTNVIGSALVTEIVENTDFDLIAPLIATSVLDELGFGPAGAVSNDVTYAVYAELLAGFELVNLANAGARLESRTRLPSRMTSICLFGSIHV